MIVLQQKRLFLAWPSRGTLSVGRGAVSVRELGLRVICNYHDEVLVCRIHIMGFSNAVFPSDDVVARVED